MFEHRHLNDNFDEMGVAVKAEGADHFTPRYDVILRSASARYRD